MERLSLSIIIGTLDREESLRQTLETIFSQTQKPDEIIIVDDGHLNREPVINLIEDHEIACLYFNKSHDHGLTKSRNLGIRKAVGDVVLFLDDDVLLDPRYIEAIMSVYEQDPNGQIGGVSGALFIKYRRGVLEFLRFFCLDSRQQGVILPSGVGSLVRHGYFEGNIRVQWLSGCNMSFRRQVFNDFLFDEAFGGNGWGDDRDFSYTVGRKYRLVATADARLVHFKTPQSRVRPERFGFMETAYLFRFFYKHMAKQPSNWLALYWAWLGIVLKNVILWNISQVRGNLQGIWTSLNNVSGVAESKEAV